jgi:hypothetical protein
VKAEESKESMERPVNRAKISAPRRAELSEAERKLKMAERSALLMQLAAIEEYLGIARRCKNCGNDL